MINVSKDDLDEIFHHIQEIIDEKTVDRNIDSDNPIESTIPEEISNVPLSAIRKSDFSRENVPWSWVYDSLRICDICKQDFALEKNLSGLTISGKFFACEHCCQTLSKEELLEWTKSRMNKPSDVRSIGVWLMSKKS